MSELELQVLYVCVYSTGSSCSDFDEMTLFIHWEVWRFFLANGGTLFKLELQVLYVCIYVCMSVCTSYFETFKKLLKPLKSF